jgi:hypothetical protein
VAWQSKHASLGLSSFYYYCHHGSPTLINSSNPICVSKAQSS